MSRQKKLQVNVPISRSTVPPYSGRADRAVPGTATAADFTINKSTGPEKPAELGAQGLESGYCCAGPGRDDQLFFLGRDGRAVKIALGTVRSRGFDHLMVSTPSATVREACRLSRDR